MPKQVGITIAVEIVLADDCPLTGDIADERTVLIPR
jgi:hypothetical protein